MDSCGRPGDIVGIPGSVSNKHPSPNPVPAPINNEAVSETGSTAIHWPGYRQTEIEVLSMNALKHYHKLVEDLKKVCANVDHV
ncbi:hypothetical protein SUGI_1477140 [Cryptomeria japonica]|uniref:Uncharacterized protein n=1 Tax=Cryptomeria japonica TaxID=3369 RepID=A0AAD3NTM5_CRYJA|nr:hypothetical protein SUGI_1477140 [Cryptomeria japonica]